MKAKQYQKIKENLESKEIEIPESIFNIKMNEELLYQVITSLEKNKKKPGAHVKTRREVEGGGRKPWPQKGTGRARHGSIRSPLWQGGGVTFGPRKEKSFQKKINKKMKRKALKIALSQKLKDEEIFFVDRIKIEQPKTQAMKQCLNQLLPDLENNVLVLLNKKKEEIIRASSNLPFCKTELAEDINALKVLRQKYLIIPQKSLKKISESFGLHNK